MRNRYPAGRGEQPSRLSRPASRRVPLPWFSSIRVDPKLAHVLGESYMSSEKALKELVDNAWDAEATEVQVTVPNILTDAPIIVLDNGSGMKTAELEAE